MSQSLAAAQMQAWNLADTLMACVILFQAGDGYAVMPSAEFDGDPETVVREFDPFEL